MRLPISYVTRYVTWHLLCHVTYLISYRSGVIAAYCSNFEHFAVCVSEPRLEAYGQRTYVEGCSSWAQWKARSKLPLSVKLFSLGVTAEAL